MIGRRALGVAACLLVALAACSCAGTRRRTPDAAPAGARMGVYRSRIEAPATQTRRFRLLLYAELPDRVHAEVLSPVGTTELILDGGGGRIAVTVPRDRVAYVGQADEAAVQEVLGIPITLPELVAALLGESAGLDGHAFTREPAGRAGLPRRFEIEGAGHRLTMRLERTAPLAASTRSVGNGEAPPGFEQRPLDALRAVEESAGGGPS